jgi:hypothetical protein
MTYILGGILTLLMAWFLVRLTYIIMKNLSNGRKFHESLLLKLDGRRLSKMLSALGINKTAYIYHANVNDIQKHMDSCTRCSHTDQCDDKLSESEFTVADISFCDNRTDLIEMIQNHPESSPAAVAKIA